MHTTPRNVRVFEILYTVAILLTAWQLYVGLGAWGIGRVIVHIYLGTLGGLVILAGEKRKIWAAWLLTGITFAWLFLELTNQFTPDLFDAMFGPAPTPIEDTALDIAVSLGSPMLQLVALGFYFFGSRQIATQP